MLNKNWVFKKILGKEVKCLSITTEYYINSIIFNILITKFRPISRYTLKVSIFLYIHHPNHDL